MKLSIIYEWLKPALADMGLLTLMLGSVAVFVAAQDRSAPSPAAKVADVAGVLTEENQRVAFNQNIWQLRELAKVLPAEEPWPANGQELQVAFAKYQLNLRTPPRSIPLPSRLTRDVYLVGQDRMLDNLTYLIDCGDAGLALIDPTYESEVERTLEHVRACGFAPENIRWVLNTHCHVDHAMADAEFHRRGAAIAAGEADATAIEKGTRVTAYYIMRELDEVINGQVRGFPKAEVAHHLADGEELRLGNKVFHVIHTPGHTPGSVCFLLQVDGKNLLFSGDTVLYDARLGWQGNPYADNTGYIASLEKLLRFKLEPRRPEPFRFDLLLPGHGAISLDQAHRDVRKALDHARWQLEHLKTINSTPFSTELYRRAMLGRPPTPVP